MRAPRFLAALLLAAAALTAHAGRACDYRPPRADAVARSMALAEHTAARLDASGAQVVVLARAGQNLSAYGLHYSHLGYAYRDGGVWRIVHKLNECGTAHASIYRQGLGQFFLENLQDYDAAFVVLSPDVQAHLLPILRDDARVAQLHTPAYSVVAYPWAQVYQQSNQWAIETLAMAMEPAAADRVHAQAWLQLHDYRPTTLHIDAWKRLGAEMTRANVAFDDHPNAKRYTDRIETVTVDSVFAWLQRSGLGSAPVVVW